MLLRQKKKYVCVLFLEQRGGVRCKGYCRNVQVHDFAYGQYALFYADVIRATSYRHGLIFGIALSVAADYYVDGR